MSNTIKLSLISVALLSSLQAKDVTELGSITVTSATKTSQSIKDITSNVNVITSEEIEEKHYTTVAEALSSISGINFTSNGGLGKSTSVQVRGFDSKRVLVLIDGVRYNDITGMSGAPFEHLMIGDIEQIEVVKGAQSGVWGADATAGVINIITKSAKKGAHASTNVEYGSFNTKKYGALASYKSDNYYVKLSSQRVESDSFSAQAPRGEDLDSFEKDGYTNTTSNIKLGFNITETNKIDISHTIIDADNNYDGFNDPDAQKTSTTNDTFTSINFNHIDSFNELDVYANKSLFDREYSTGSKYDGEVYEYGLKSNISYGEKDFLVWGADYKTFEHKNDLNKKYTNKAVFLTNSNNFDGTIITESLRSDTYDKFENKITGKLGIKHLVKSIDGLSASANYGTAYNVPTLFNLYAPAGDWGPVGNEDLTPESTSSYDISIKYKVIKITYFNSDIENMIDWGDGYENILGTSTIKGYEIEYNDEMTKDLFINANYTYLDAKDKDEIALARRTKDSANLSLDYYGIKDLHLGVSAQYIGERYDDADEQGQQTGKYTVVNFVTSYEVNNNFSIYAKVDNVFDKYYQVVDGYATAPLSGYAGIKAKF